MNEEEFKPYKDNDILERAMNYLCLVLIIKRMLCKGIINAEDYEKAEKWAAEKYGIPEKSLYRFDNIITSKTDDE